MALNKEVKTKIIKDFARDEKDTGSPEVQIAILTNEINALTEHLKKYPLVKINSTNKSIPHILNVSVKGVKSIKFQETLNSHGVYVSTKSACSVPNTPSRAVYEVYKDRKNALSSWRISLSHLTTMEEVQEFLKVFDICYNALT